MSAESRPKYEPPILPDLDADPLVLDCGRDEERLRRIYRGDSESERPGEGSARPDLDREDGGTA